METHFYQTLYKVSQNGWQLYTIIVQLYNLNYLQLTHAVVSGKLVRVVIKLMPQQDCMALRVGTSGEINAVCVLPRQLLSLISPSVRDINLISQTSQK